MFVVDVIAMLCVQERKCNLTVTKITHFNHLKDRQKCAFAICRRKKEKKKEHCFIESLQDIAGKN